MGFSERIKLLINESGGEKSQADLARFAHVKEPTVTGWVNGSIKSLKADTCLMVARYFGVNPYWLYYGEGKRKHPLPPEEQLWLEFGKTLTDEDKDAIYRLFKRVKSTASEAGVDNRRGMTVYGSKKKSTKRKKIA